MLSLLIICFIGGAIGAMLQGMVGVGTGIIVVPLLTFVLPHYGVPPGNAMHIALATSMAAITTNSISALRSHYRHGNIKWPLFNKLILFSLVGAFLGALAASHLSGNYLQILFGIFLLLNAAHMLFKKSISAHLDQEPYLTTPKAATGGLIIGFIASIVGSGGGVLMVPFLQSLKLKMRYVVGTSTLIAFPVSFVGAVTYCLLGLHKINPSFHTIGYLHWPAFLAITAAGVLAAPLGVKLATRLPTHFLQRLFALCMILIGIQMIA